MKKPFFIVLMGVTGVGKTTAGRLLAMRLGAKFLDADEFHSASNIEKMSKGQPLSDAERIPWLAKLRRAATSELSAGRSVVMACSALKRRYRMALKAAGSEPQFVYLKAPAEIIRGRILSRKGHFADERILESQFRDLEEPSSDQAITVDASLSENEVTEAVLEALGFEPF